MNFIGQACNYHSLMGQTATRDEVTGCAKERPSGSGEGVVSNRGPYSDQQLSTEANVSDVQEERAAAYSRASHNESKNRYPHSVWMPRPLFP
jgi:hypothetical protein